MSIDDYAAALQHELDEARIEATVAFRIAIRHELRAGEVKAKYGAGDYYRGLSDAHRFHHRQAVARKVRIAAELAAVA